MYILVNKIRTKNHVTLPTNKEGYFIPLVSNSDSLEYLLLTITQLENGLKSDSIIVLLEYTKKKSFPIIRRNLENLAHECKSLNDLMSKTPTLSGEGFKFIEVDYPSNTFSETATNYAYFENEKLTDLVQLKPVEKFPVRCSEVAVTKLSGIMLPSYLVESYDSKICSFNGTYWLQVKTSKGRKEEAYHLKGSISNIPIRLKLLDLPEPTSHDCHYAFNERTLEYTNEVATVTIEKNNFFSDIKNNLYLKLGGVIVNLGKVDFDAWCLNFECRGYLTVMYSRHRKFSTLWDNGVVNNPLDYLIKLGVLVERSELEEVSLLG